MPDTLITKASGAQVPFDRSKLAASLSRAGALPETVDAIVAEIEAELLPGMETGRIYHKAFALLRRQSRPTAARYKLKRAIQEMGPTGFPFEKFVGELLRARGYTVQVGQVMAGACVSHEVDVLADNAERRLAIECKFGNSRDKKIDIKTALYVHARVLDLARGWHQTPNLAHKQVEAWIVTNGVFSSDAIKYGACAGMNLVSWDYPARGNLKDLVEQPGLYPLTILVSLTKAEKQYLLDQGIVLGADLQRHPEWLDPLHLSKNKRRNVLDELDALCQAPS
ncbi:MAG: hypothetical protein OHK0039_11130 [Bacteroidia bacterium]